MKTKELEYYLPPELIAQHPAEKRASSKLMVLNKKSEMIEHKKFENIIDYLNPGDCLVINNTKVLPARFYAKRSTGAKIEGLFLSSDTPSCWSVMLKNARKIKSPEDITLKDKSGNDFCLATACQTDTPAQWTLNIKIDTPPIQILEKIGFAPLPPYIKRYSNDPSTENDIERYQTIYAKDPGAVAAPTAGLHFTDKLMENIKQKGVNVANLTLHVGAGTFKPVSVEDLQHHEIHSEYYQLDQQNADLINQTIQNKKRIIAVGTTSVRTLETLATKKHIDPGSGHTKLFITPGYEFKITDAIITNFHLPKSTLLALVGAFAGMDTVKAAYQIAIQNRYRFFSYGDAMLIY